MTDKELYQQKQQSRLDEWKAEMEAAWSALSLAVRDATAKFKDQTD